MFLLDSHLYSIQNTNAITPSSSSSSRGSLCTKTLKYNINLFEETLFLFFFFICFEEIYFQQKKIPFVKILSICFFPLIRFAQCADLMFFFFLEFFIFHLDMTGIPYGSLLMLLQMLCVFVSDSIGSVESRLIDAVY